jgi:hypothetical protein
MPGWAWIAIAVAVVIVVGVIAATLARQKGRERTSRLRRRFGPEYDRAVKTAGGRRKGETELERRLQRRERLQIAVVRSSERSAYESEWKEIDAQFEETPVAAIAQADALVATILAGRGYPMQEGFGERAGDLSVDHPDAVEHYRRAHATFRESDNGGLSQEDLYEALQHYRALIDELVGGERPQRPPQDEAPAEPGFAQDDGRRDSR